MGLGIVLSGGGARGAYQIGVWRALRELGCEKEIAVATGSSVGALNAAMFVQGNLERAEAMWLRGGIVFLPAFLPAQTHRRRSLCRRRVV